MSTGNTKTNPLTNKDPAHARDARLLVRKPPLVSLEAREADRHLGHDPGQDRAEALVERERRLAAHDERAGREEPARFCLLRGERGMISRGSWVIKDYWASSECVVGSK